MVSAPRGLAWGWGRDENPEEGHSDGSKVRMASRRLGGLCWALRDQWDEEGQRKGAELWSELPKVIQRVRVHHDSDSGQGAAIMRSTNHYPLSLHKVKVISLVNLCDHFLKNF